MTRTRVTQPAIFVHQYALAQLLAELGATPDAVVGHSVGEFAAAVTSGHLELAEAVAILAARAELLDRHGPRGIMAAVPVSLEAAAEAISAADLAGRVLVAAVNAPEMVTIAALDAEAYHAFVAQMGPTARCRRLAVECAFHTPLDEGALAAFAEAVPPPAAGTTPRATFVSTLTGAPLVPGDLTAEYWARQVAEPVAFLDAVRTCADGGPTVWAEIGAETTLLPLLRRILGEGGHDLAPAAAWHGAKNECDAVLALVDRLFAAAPDQVRPAGLAELAAVAQDGAIRPPYPFRRVPHWLPSRHAAGHYDVPGVSPAPAAVAQPARKAAGQPARASANAAALAMTILSEVARVCRREPSEVRPEHDFWVDLEFDSMMFVDLQLRLERALHLPRKVPFEAYAKLRTVADLISLAETAAIEPEAIA